MFVFRIKFCFRSKKVRNDYDDNDLSKDGENSLSQSIFDDQSSSRTRSFLIFLYHQLLY